MTENKPLQGKTALVTGASRNLGRVIAHILAEQGASLSINYLTTDPQSTGQLDELRAIGQPVHVFQGDMALPDDVRRVMQQALDAHGGRVDILINNAGPFNGDRFTVLAETEWDRIMNCNLKAVYLATQLVAPAMQAVGWGRIITISAGSAYVHSDGVYGLAKSVVNTLTAALALELGPEITVNAVAPGQIVESAPDISEIDPTYVERAIKRSPSGRLVTRGEVAGLVAWLCTPAADSLTGLTIPIDGGWHINRF